MPAPLMYGATLIVEAALSAATGTYGAWGSGLWDTATWGPDVVWQDISQWVRSVSTTRRFSRDLQAWEAGSARIDLRNGDARFTPENLAGPYVTAGVTQIRPWRPIRVRMIYGGVTYPVYQGYGLSWDEYYEQPSPNGGGSFVVVSCVDELARLAKFGGLAQVAAGGGETTGKRIHRILDNSGHKGPRNIDLGRVTVQPTTLENNTVAELKLTADSEGGAFYIDAEGVPTFENQYALIENARSNTSQVTYGDGAGELAYSEIVPANGGELLTNIASFARVGGVPQTATDETSRSLYEDARTTRTDLICETDAQVAGLAQTWVARYAQPERRFASVRISVRGHESVAIPDVLGRRVRDLVRVKRRPPGGITLSRDCYVSGISHVITADNIQTTFEFWSGTPYSTFSTSRWGTGTWDSATWFY
jgi:hypothetical protein